MKKILIVLVVVCVAFVLALKVGVTFLAHQLGEQTRQTLVEHIGLAYQGFDTDLINGLVYYEQVETNIFGLKRTITAERISISFGGPIDMLKGLISLGQGQIDYVQRLVIEGGKSDLQASLSPSWLSRLFGRKAEILLANFTCVDGQVFDRSAWQMMGVEGWEFELVVQSDESQMGAWSWLLHSDVLGEFQVNWLAETENNLAFWDVNFIEVGLQKIQAVSLRYTENGFLRRLENFCMRRTELGDLQFPVRHIQAILRKLNDQGIKTDEVFSEVLNDFYKQGGVLLAEIAYAEGADERSKINMQTLRLAINASDFASSTLRMFPLPEIEPEQISNAANTSMAPRQIETFQLIEKTELELLLGERVRVTTLRGKQYAGILRHVDAFKLEIAQAAEQGQVAYVVDREEIAQLETWR
jgi:hypothetical protein